jgi:citrate lyase subunit beta/citryl-CoA lyase
MGGYGEVGARLEALTWGAEDLSVALGASTAVDADGEWLFTYQLARSLCLAAAAAAGVAAIDTVYTDFRDARGLQLRARDARRDGFAGKLAIHPEQIGIINEAFLPSSEEIAAARRVVAAFDAAEGETGDDAGEIGVAALDGKMLDRPHVIRARRLLALAAKQWKGP